MSKIYWFCVLFGFFAESAIWEKEEKANTGKQGRAEIGQEQLRWQSYLGLPNQTAKIQLQGKE